MFKPYFRLFLTVVAVSILLMIYQSRTGPLRPFGFLSSSINHIDLLISSSGDLFDEALRKITLRERDVVRLREEVRALKLEAMMKQKLEDENRRLREALSLKEQQPGYVATARVVSRGNGRWSNTFVIDKGRNDLVEKDMVAVTPQGLLGKVMELEDSFSKILLIDDTWFSAAVRIEDARTEAVLSGAGARKCRLKYLSVEEEVEEGDVVITSGLDEIFPPGIWAGYISKVTTDEKELFHEIEVIPFVDTRKVEEVTIVRR